MVLQSSISARIHAYQTKNTVNWILLDVASWGQGYQLLGAGGLSGGKKDVNHFGEQKSDPTKGNVAGLLTALRENCWKFVAINLKSYQSIWLCFLQRYTLVYNLDALVWAWRGGQFGLTRTEVLLVEYEEGNAQD